MLKLLQQRFTSTSAVCRMAATPTQKPVESIIKNKPVDGESRKKINLLQRVLHVRRVARVNSGGKIRSISALVVVGDQNGSAGYGMGRGTDISTAVQKAAARAEKNMSYFLRLDNRTIYSNIDYKFHKVHFKFKAARPGYGVVANNNIHEVCRCIGISDLYCKVIGSQNPMNVIKGTFEALGSQKRPIDSARMRGQMVADVEMTYYGTKFSQ